MLSIVTPSFSSCFPLFSMLRSWYIYCLRRSRIFRSCFASITCLLSISRLISSSTCSSVNICCITLSFPFRTLILFKHSDTIEVPILGRKEGGLFDQTFEYALHLTLAMTHRRVNCANKLRTCSWLPIGWFAPILARK